MPHIIVLSGPSSSGKTSIAAAIRTISAGRFVHLEADLMMPQHAESPNPDVDRSRRIQRALYRSMAAYAQQDLDVIVDGALPYGDPTGYADCLATLRAAGTVTVVGVRCAIERLRERERERNHPLPGWAERQALDIHTGIMYDIEVDTTLATPEQCARQVLSALPGAHRI